MWAASMPRSVAGPCSTPPISGWCSMTWVFCRTARLPLVPAASRHRPHAGGHADAGGGDIAAQEFHRVDDAEARADTLPPGELM